MDLENIGLSKRESVCYIALLELGTSKVGEIINKTNIPSSKIYEVLNRLIEKGLVSYVIKGKVKYFQASHPQFLLNDIDEKRKKLNEMIPLLIQKSSKTNKQQVEVYEGQKAVFSLLTDLINNSKPKELYMVFSINEENKGENANTFFRNITLRRKERKLDVRILKNISYYKKEKHTKVKIRFTNFNLPQGITIFRDNMIILSWGENPIAIRVTSEIFSNEMKNFFLELWEKSKE